jgi:hypothetical protein
VNGRVIDQVRSSTFVIGVAAGSQPWKSPAMKIVSPGGVPAGSVTVNVTATARVSAEALVSADGSERLKLVSTAVTT